MSEASPCPGGFCCVKRKECPDTDLGVGSSIDHLEGGAKNVLLTVSFLQNCAQLVYFFGSRITVDGRP
jgi:hypothetical protein